MADAEYDPSCFYHRLSALPLVQEMVRQALQGYEKTKDSSPLLSSALTSVESGVVRAAERARPTYDEYLQDKVAVASKTAAQTLAYFEKNYPQINITPEQLRQAGLDYYEQSMLKKAVDVAYATKQQAVDAAIATKNMGASAVTATKDVAVATTNIGVGAVVVSTQLSFAAAIAAASLGIDAFIASKNAGVDALRAINRSEKVVHEALVHALLTGKTTVSEVTRLASAALKGPTDKILENTNAFLDVLDTIVDRYIVDGTEDELPKDNNTSSSLYTRVTNLGGKVATGLSVKANRQVFFPLKRSIRRAVGELHGALALLEYVKQTKSWASQQAVEGAERVSESVSNLMKTLETQAKLYKVKPETLLLRTIRMSSSALSNAANQLLKRSDSIMPEPYRTQVHNAVLYVHSLDESFAEAQSLYDVRDEVVSEAKERLTAVEKSLVGAVDRIADYPPMSWMTSANSLQAVGKDCWDFSDLDDAFPSLQIRIPNALPRYSANFRCG